jgi:hypothetical protein
VRTLNIAVPPVDVTLNKEEEVVSVTVKRVPLDPLTTSMGLLLLPERINDPVIATLPETLREAVTCKFCDVAQNDPVCANGPATPPAPEDPDDPDVPTPLVPAVPELPEEPVPPDAHVTPVDVDVKT